MQHWFCQIELIELIQQQKAELRESSIEPIFKWYEKRWHWRYV